MPSKVSLQEDKEELVKEMRGRGGRGGEGRVASRVEEGLHIGPELSQILREAISVSGLEVSLHSVHELLKRRHHLPLLVRRLSFAHLELDVLECLLVGEDQCEHRTRQRPLVRTVIVDHSLKEKSQQLPEHLRPFSNVTIQGSQRLRILLARAEAELGDVIESSSAVGGNAHVVRGSHPLETVLDVRHDLQENRRLEQAQVRGVVVAENLLQGEVAAHDLSVSH
mmetsp:Transcript_32763/g.73626  ORF Transcript_32763/g.73626 Transcript_32763/m.73626 type:complete len:224 (-) Transcript_32763:2723-3394(-)